MGCYRGNGITATRNTHTHTHTHTHAHTHDHSLSLVHLHHNRTAIGGDLVLVWQVCLGLAAIAAVDQQLTHLLRHLHRESSCHGDSNRRKHPKLGVQFDPQGAHRHAPRRGRWEGLHTISRTTHSNVGHNQCQLDVINRAGLCRRKGEGGRRTVEEWRPGEKGSHEQWEH